MNKTQWEEKKIIMKTMNDQEMFKNDLLWFFSNCLQFPTLQSPKGLLLKNLGQERK